MPGKYRMQWRMRISLPARWNEPTDFVALPESRKGVPLAEAVRYTTPPDLYRREDVVTDTWVQITLPSVIEIREAWGFTQVRVSHEKDSAFYKSGLVRRKKNDFANPSCREVHCRLFICRNWIGFGLCLPRAAALLTW